MDSNLYKSKSVLRGSELFKYRKLADKSLPNVGGSKDFAPDSSWLQNKKLEKFYEERLELLSEQRVERVGSLVTGDWNPEEQLIELHKELGKFWVHMGFVDKSRKWLYPEEALYLMETNTMEVKYKGLPLSIQQAYRCCLNSCITLDQYQVYSHLRRLGFVIIRHQGRFNTTEYERKIKLDQHMILKKKKAKKRKAETEKDDSSAKLKKEIETADSMEVSDSLLTDKSFDVDSTQIKKMAAIDEKTKDYICDEKSLSSRQEVPCNMDTEDSVSECRGNKASDLNEEHRTSNLPNSSNDLQTHPCGDVTTDEYVTYKMQLKNRNSDPDVVVNFSQLFFNSVEVFQTLKSPTWDFSVIKFPDFGKEKVLHISKADQNSKLFPLGVDLPDSFIFDMEQYASKFSKNNKGMHEEDNDLRNLDYSFPTSSKNRTLGAKNWRDYKEKLLKSSIEECMLSSPAAHLWTGDVKPLVRPCDGVDTDTILEKLQVVKSSTGSKATSITEIIYKVIFDVYLPDAKFRKSSPGLPHHRLCVLRNTDPLPDLHTLSQIIGYYTDGVPLHWAVVDCGDIAFYDFTQITMPVML